MQHVIYEPKGPAREYAPLACNLWLTCSHGCRYCYVPRTLHKDPGEFFKDAPEREGVLDVLERDCTRIAGDIRPILLCFCCDPYQPHDFTKGVTRAALEILARYNLRVRILTKGGMRAARDFDLLARNRWEFGTSLSFLEDSYRVQWECGAASIRDRIDAISAAKEEGIMTWVSAEPIIYERETLDLISVLRDKVDFWHFGPLNHLPGVSDLNAETFMRRVIDTMSIDSYNFKSGMVRYAA